MSKTIADRVLDRLQSKGYVDDERFTRFWVENRNQTKGSSKRKIVSELRSKGVHQEIIEQATTESSRSDETEIDKIIIKKRNKYDDQKLMQYLARQGFDYDLIKQKISETQLRENETD